MSGSWWDTVRDAVRGLVSLGRPEVRRHLERVAAHERSIVELCRENPGARVASDVWLYGWAPSRIRIGHDSVVERGTLLVAGDDFNGYGTIDIRPGSWIGQYNNLRASQHADIVIGERVLMAQFCTIVGANHDVRGRAGMIDRPARRDGNGVRIEADAWLGAGVVVLPDVVVGEGAVVGANSVVSRSIPAFEIWAGVPARRIGVRDES